MIKLLKVIMTQQEFWILSFQISLVILRCLIIIIAIVKYRNHSSILAIGEVCKKNPQFSISCVDKNEILK